MSKPTFMIPIGCKIEIVINGEKYFIENRYGKMMLGKEIYVDEDSIPPVPLPPKVAIPIKGDDGKLSPPPPKIPPKYTL